MMVKSTSALLATTLMASSAMASTDAPWLDWTSSTTTTTTTKKVDPATSTSVADPWLDWTSSTTTTTTKKVVASTSSTYDPWLDWTSSTTTTKKVDPATSTTYAWADWTSTSAKPVSPVTTTSSKPVAPAVTSSVWGDWDEVDPAAATCGAVTVTYTGVGFWVPDPAGAWADWTSSTTTTKPVAAATTTTSAWVDPTWSDWVASTTTTKKVSVSTTTTTAWVDPTWSDWVSSSTTLVTTTKGSWGSSSTGAATTTKATTTTAAPKPAPTCPSDNGKKVLAGGSCGCEYTVNCGVKASPDAKSVFWEKVSGGIVPTLGECLALCDANDKCEATLWVDDASNGDYHHCWQISGLGAPTGTGVAQISYKGTCSGKCTESYSKA